VKRVFKYAVPANDEFTLSMPTGARLLSVQSQLGEPFLWALVDDAAETATRKFALRGTGHDAEGLEGSVFVGTFQLANGRLIFHLFDLGER